MATVTSFTKERMEEIEDTSIVDGNVVGDSLILEQRDGTTINAGNVRGPEGTPGPAGSPSLQTKKLLLPAVLLRTIGPRVSYSNFPTIAAKPFSASWSPDGKHIAWALKDSPFINIYRFNGRGFVKLSDPTFLPPSKAWDIAWSPDGKYISVVSDTTPYLTVYSFNGTSLVKISTPTPPENSRGVSWSKDGRFMSVVHNGTNAIYVTTYSFDNETFTPIADVPGSLGGTAYCVDWSPSGRYLAVGRSLSPNVLVFSFDGTNFTQLSDPDVDAVGRVNRLEWSHDEKYLAAAHQSSPYLSLYNFDGATLTKTTDPAVLPADDCVYLSWSPDCKFLSVMSAELASDENLTTYKLINGVLHKMPRTIEAQGSGTLVKWAPNGKSVATGHNTGTLAKVYDTFAKHVTDGSYTTAWEIT